MYAKSYQHMQTPTSQDPTVERPLAQSALSGEARLIELEHLAETARKVRDQAASELTRNNGSSHHVARERMAAAERMLRKAQQEIAELRSRQNDPDTVAPADQRKDFELAVMLGHSKARLNLETPPQLTLQEQQFSRRDREDRRTPPKRSARSASGWRSLAFTVLVVAGIGISAVAISGFLSTGTIDGAAQAVRDSTGHMVDRLRGLLAVSAADNVDLAA